jgi:autotransporter-associated beta strand protein
MAHSNSWDETNPTNATAATSIDDEIRKLRLDTRERLAVDHNLTASDAGAATVGYHKQITFEDDLASDPGKSGDVTSLYPKKLATGRIVPFFEDSTSVVRLLLGDSNAKAWLYTATAPVGWKVSSGAPTDCALAAVGGSTYTTAGATAGTWTLSGLTMAHTHSGTTDVNTSDVYPEGGGAGTAAKHDHSHTFTTGAASNGTVASAGTWRISAAVNKLYEPDTTM